MSNYTITESGGIRTFRVPKNIRISPEKDDKWLFHVWSYMADLEWGWRKYTQGKFVVGLEVVLSTEHKEVVWSLKEVIMGYEGTHMVVTMEMVRQIADPMRHGFMSKPYAERMKLLLEGFEKFKKLVEDRLEFWSTTAAPVALTVPEDMIVLELYKRDISKMLPARHVVVATHLKKGDELSGLSLGSGSVAHSCTPYVVPLENGDWEMLNGPAAGKVFKSKEYAARFWLCTQLESASVDLIPMGRAESSGFAKGGQLSLYNLVEAIRDNHAEEEEE